MQKIPTIFDRDWNGDRSKVTREPHKLCGWVFDGEGIATKKLDGTCVLVRGGQRYKRRELKAGEVAPPLFELAGRDDETGKVVGWLPVGDGPEDRWHREAKGGGEDGTYELLGPKVQGNVEQYQGHELVRHGSVTYENVPRDFDGLRDWLSARDIEGIVFHHQDGRMAKIKKRDFGLPRKPAA